MEKQLKVKILPETAPNLASKFQNFQFISTMDHKSSQGNAKKWVRRHDWKAVSCPTSPTISMNRNGDELFPPSIMKFRNYPFSPIMDHKSRSQNSTKWIRPHSWKGSVSCPSSPMVSMIANADELSPPSTFLRNQANFHNRSSGRLSKNAASDGTKVVHFADANIRNLVAAMENSSLPSETRKPIYNGSKCTKTDSEPTSPKISCMGEIKLKKRKKIEKAKDREEKKHVTMFQRLFNFLKPKSEVRRKSNASAPQDNQVCPL
ncbi:hypothetical protein MtrunA17_Chr3g0096111 [Medicago truncatula]|uniref:Uncharacterized protein n=1 Tax=Medicago truncatula TaxID=3880 RepID=A0A396IR46_MEDTR|nr:uncharacterized protein LOC112419984 [Medicago truncatula]RHN66844.1 hypothetical protein MtrunA17_Chr3g0096111 [Medicago truncatula]